MSEQHRGRAYAGTVVVSSLVTVAALFGAQELYGPYARLSDSTVTRDSAANVRLMRAEQRAKLETGPLPIDRAMQRFASTSRTSFDSLAPVASSDPAPAAGWMHHPGYQAPPVPEAPAEAPAPPPTPEVPAEGATEEAAGVVPVPAPAPAPAAAPAAAPAGRTVPPAVLVQKTRPAPPPVAPDAVPAAATATP